MPHAMTEDHPNEEGEAQRFAPASAAARERKAGAPSCECTAMKPQVEEVTGRCGGSRPSSNKKF